MPTKPTARDIEALAEWLHEQFLATTRASVVPIWVGLSKQDKANYRYVAKLMLERPPMVLVEAVRRLGE